MPYRQAVPSVDRQIKFGRKVASRKMRGCHCLQGGRLSLAAFLRKCTSRVKIAPGWRRRWAQGLALQEPISTRHARIGDRNGAQQRGGIWVAWPAEHRIGG